MLNNATRYIHVIYEYNAVTIDRSNIFLKKQVFQNLCVYRAAGIGYGVVSDQGIC